MFGLKVCHKHLLSGVPLLALLAPMPLFFATALLVKIKHSPRGQHLSTLVTRPPSIASVGSHVAAQRPGAFEGLMTQLTAGIPCLNCWNFKGDILPCSPCSAHPSSGQDILKDALDASFHFRSRRSRWFRSWL